MTALLACLVAAAALPPEEVRFQPRATSSEPRLQRRWVFSTELGWNSLGGVGLVLARHLDANFTLEAGMGLSAVGPKAGLRGRYLFLPGAWTPFLGLGFLYGAGSGPGSTPTFGNVPRYRYSIGPSPYLQAVIGLEYQSAGGFNCTAATGYVGLLRQNLTVTGPASQDDLATLRLLTGRGPVFSFSLGYAF